jgi:hypothetical protein
MSTYWQKRRAYQLEAETRRDEGKPDENAWFDSARPEDRFNSQNKRRMLMKWNFVRTALATILGATLLTLGGLFLWSTTAKKSIPSLPVVHAGSPTGCSTESVAGNWGFTLNGTLILPTGLVPAAGVARGIFDAQGNITSGATEARNVGGGFANETVTGSWIVKPDCTGTLTIYAYESGTLVRTSVLAIVFVDNLNEVLMVQDSLTLPDGSTLPVVITAEGKRVLSQSSNSQ